MQGGCTLPLLCSYSNKLTHPSRDFLYIALLTRYESRYAFRALKAQGIERYVAFDPRLNTLGIYRSST